jgi:glycosyltransferase involved in cell wall biosynthesis
VTARVPGAALALVGDGPDADELRALAGNGVLFAGERNDVKDWLAAADVVVLPSRWEGMSIGLLEAIASGRSVVATAAAGSAEAVGEEAGVIVPVEDPHALADEIAKRLLDPDLAAAEGRAGRRRAETLFDVRKRTAQTAELYGELRGRRRSA